MPYLKFIKSYFIIFLTAALLLLAGCKTRFFNHSDNQAQILVISSGHSTPVTIMFDNHLVGELSPDTVLRVNVSAGSYLIKSNHISSFPVDITLNEGEIANIIVKKTNRGLWFQSISSIEFETLSNNRKSLSMSLDD